MASGERGAEGPGWPDPDELPEFVERMLDVIDSVPRGRVTTYGDIAELLEGPGPRRIGALMSGYGALTRWWRVVRADGTLPPVLHEQAQAHWRREGTPMRGDKVAMTQARWPERTPGP